MMEEEGFGLYASDDSSDTTSLSYWANWRVLVCAIWVFTPMILAFWTIWRYESPKSFPDDDDDRNRNWNRDSIGDEAWKPCLREIHPIWVLIFRVVAFFALLATLIAKIYYSGGSTYFYYTQWTFTLLTIYFGFGSVLSFIGCLKYASVGVSRFSVSGDTEQGLHTTLISNETTKSLGAKRNVSEKSESVFRSLRFWTCLLEIIFQINVGAVTLTDLVYWFVIYPFLTTQDYSPSGLAIAMHSINAVFLLGDAALNCLQVPLMRMTFFILWTGFYVVFQWIFHAFVPLWWAYPFLDLSLPYAPLWYLLVASLHIPCYCLFVLFVKIKRYSLSKWFPNACQC